MRKQSILLKVAAAGCVLAAADSSVKAAEFALGTYGLGSSSFGAGVTPPAGTYVTSAAGFYQADISGPLTLGRVRLNAGAKVDFFTSALNLSASSSSPLPSTKYRRSLVFLRASSAIWKAKVVLPLPVTPWTAI